MACDADTLGTQLIASLIEDVSYETPNVSLINGNFTVPEDSVLTADVNKLVNEDLTTRTVDGNGVFDALMAGFSAHLIQEYNKNRITGAEYTKAYTALSEAAMAQGSAFLMSRDKQYWDNLVSQQQAQLAQVQVATSKIKLETAKVEHAVTQLQALNLKAQYASIKMDIALKSSQFCISEYTLNNMMPKQLQMLNEQYQTALAQTSDTKSDGSPVVGNLGMQKALHAEQIVAYRNESQVKVAKLYTDAFITQFTINDEINVPNEFKELSVNSTIEALKANVGLPPSPTNGGGGGGGSTPIVGTNNTVVSGMTAAGMVYGTGTAGTIVEIEATDGSNTIVAVVASNGTYSVQYPVPHDYAAVPQMTYKITTRASSGGNAVGSVTTFTPTQGYVYVVPITPPLPPSPPVVTDTITFSNMTSGGLISGTGVIGSTITLTNSLAAYTVTGVVDSSGNFNIQWPVSYDFSLPYRTTFIATAVDSNNVPLPNTFTWIPPEPAPITTDPSWANVTVDYVTNGDSTVTVTINNAVVNGISEPGALNISTYPSMADAIAWFTPLVWYSSGLPTITFN